MTKNLPSGLTSARVTELVTFNPKHLTSAPDATPVSFVPMAAVSESSPELDSSQTRPLGDVRKGYTHFSDGDVLFAKITPCMENGKGGVASALKNGLGCGTTGLMVLRSLGGVDPLLLYRFLAQPSVRREAKENFTGTAGQARVPVSFLENLELPLVPLAEQRRIVAKLEHVLGRVDACQRRLAKIPALLKRFRQAVIAAACSGSLTADWREDDSEEDGLPVGWIWRTVESLLPPGGIFDGPFGSNLKSDDYTDSGIRVVRLENIGRLRFIAEKETFISREKYETLKRHSVGEGDIMFASFISEEIRACVLPKLSTKAIAKADCFCLRPLAELIDRAYLVFQLVSQPSYNALVENVHGATRPRINTTQLRKLEIRLCPLPEQQEIVRRVEALFALADRIEARYAKAQAQVDRLMPSLLARAFAGKLVPQDPSDEPALLLLERLQAAQKEAPAQNPRNPKKQFKELRA